MRFEQWKVGPMDNFVYVFADENGTAALVDPAFEVEQTLARAEALGLRITHILATHGHPDHVQGIPKAARLTKAKTYAHESADHETDVRLNDGDTFRVGSIEVRVIHTPGHRFDAVCFIVDGTHVLTGDTLFVGECGRLDLPGADVPAMHETLLTRLAALDGGLIVCPGHDYGATPTSTLDHERKTNYVLKPRTLAEFERFMAE